MLARGHDRLQQYPWASPIRSRSCGVGWILGDHFIVQTRDGGASWADKDDG